MIDSRGKAHVDRGAPDGTGGRWAAVTRPEADVEVRSLVSERLALLHAADGGRDVAFADLPADKPVTFALIRDRQDAMTSATAAAWAPLLPHLDPKDYRPQAARVALCRAVAWWLDAYGQDAMDAMDQAWDTPFARSLMLVDSREHKDFEGVDFCAWAASTSQALEDEAAVTVTTLLARDAEAVVKPAELAG